MQGTAFAQGQQQRTIPVQIQANAILNMSLIELQQFIETETMENPALSVAEGSRCPVCGFMTRDKACPICGASMVKADEHYIERDDERGYLERAYASVNEDNTFDPFRTVAANEGIQDYLKQQARMCLAGRKLRIAEYLIDSLDDDGYFRESLFETAEEFTTAVPEVESILTIIQSFDPPGIAARDLRECLLIQLRALGAHGTTISNAERILLDYWDDFSKLKLKAIAKKMAVTEAVVYEASDLIREKLTPYPANVYRQPFDELSPNDTAAVVPDVVLHKKGDSFTVEVIDSQCGLLGIDETYDELYQSIKQGKCYLNGDDSRHITEHVERVKCILEAIALRKKTLARVAVYLADYQKEFILSGPSRLKPLRQKDVAKALEVHESTICRAVAGKYCRMPSGEVISFEVFFDSALPIRHMIRELIALSSEPLSDGDIAKKLAEQGVAIARRTVAKYREQLKLLPYQLRAA